MVPSPPFYKAKPHDFCTKSSNFLQQGKVRRLGLGPHKKVKFLLFLCLNFLEDLHS